MSGTSHGDLLKEKTFKISTRSALEDWVQSVQRENEGEELQLISFSSN